MRLPQFHLRDLFWLVLVAGGWASLGGWSGRAPIEE